MIKRMKGHQRYSKSFGCQSDLEAIRKAIEKNHETIAKPNPARKESFDISYSGKTLAIPSSNFITSNYNSVGRKSANLNMILNYSIFKPSEDDSVEEYSKIPRSNSASTEATVPANYKFPPDSFEIDMSKVDQNIDSKEVPNGSNRSRRGSAHRTPERWFSLRNIISFSNVLINILAILIISLVSYFASYESTRSAINEMGVLTLNDLTIKLSNILKHAEEQNIHTEDLFRVHQIGSNDTDTIIKHFLFTYSQNTTPKMDQVYFATSDNNYFCGMELLPRDLKAINLMSGGLFRNTYLVDQPCNEENSFCSDYPNLKLKLLRNITYATNTRPYFQKALTSKTISWTVPYKFSSTSKFGISSVRPVFVAQTMIGVASVDISLVTLSNFLKLLASSIVANNNFKKDILVWITEKSTGNLIASSQIMDTSQQLLAVKSGNSIIASNSNLECSAVIDNKYMNKDSLIICKAFKNRDIDWNVFLHIPSEIFLGQLNRKYITAIPLVSCLVLLVSVFISFNVTRIIVRPLKAISEKMMRVADLNFDEDVFDDELELENDSSFSYLRGLVTKKLSSYYKMGKDEPKKKNPKKPSFCSYQLKEIKYLQSAMSSLTTGLKSLSKYVPLDVVTLLLKLKREAVLGVDENELTIMFTDIANFTSISESMERHDLIALMGEYFTEVSQIIIDSDGVVDKYIGDAVMAFWNAPMSVDNHPIVACGVALNIQKRLKILQRQWLAKGYPLIETRIGLNTGISLVGNFGSPNRLNYTCLGDSVNLSSRLEGLNKVYGTKIIISESTFSKVKDFFLCKPLGKVAVKGKRIAVEIYELLDFLTEATPNKIWELAIYHKGYQFFTLGNFHLAKELFTEYLYYNPRDVTTIRHLDVCNRQLDNPEKNWDSTVVFDQK